MIRAICTWSVGVLAALYAEALAILLIALCALFDQPRDPLGRLAGAVAGPCRLFVSPARERNHRRVDQHAGLHCHRPRMQSLGDQSEQARVAAMLDEGAARADERGPLRRRLEPRRATEASERHPIVKRVGELHIRQVMPHRDQEGLKQRQGRPSRFAAAGPAGVASSASSIGDQSVRSRNSSSALTVSRASKSKVSRPIPRHGAQPFRSHSGSRNS